MGGTAAFTVIECDGFGELNCRTDSCLIRGDRDREYEYYRLKTVKDRKGQEHYPLSLEHCSL